MLRIIRYLKPYLPLVILAIALLFIQANADLALPDYMSKIVNFGIQQGGVENAVPTAIRQSEMDKLTLFMTAADKQSVLTDYTLVDKNSVNYSTLVKQYPALSSVPVYVLNSTASTEVDKIDPILGKAILSVSAVNQVLADPAKAAAIAKGFGGFDISKLPAGTDIFTLLAKLPPSVVTQMTTAINAKFASMGSRTINQAAAKDILAEYAALGMDAGKLQINYIVKTGLTMLLLSLLSISCTLVVGFLSARTAAGSARDLRKDVFQKVESFSSTEFDKFSTASLITRSTNDITQIQMVVLMLIRMVFYAPIMGVGGIIRAVNKSSSMWWIIALAVIVLISVVIVIFSISLPKFRIIQSLIDRLNLVTRENLSGMMVIRSFNMQAWEENRFDKANQDLTSTSLFVNRVMVVMMPFMMLIMNGLTLLIIWVGAHQVAESTMQVGDMMAFMQYAIQIVFSFLMLSMMFIILPRASVSADRIADVLETRPVIDDPDYPEGFQGLSTGKIEFRNVSFRYPEGVDDALHEINFTAWPGETTALIGATGSGKTTVVSLIPRFYEVTDGAIFVNGVDVRQVTQQDLREQIGYVPQKGSLFSGTIESNLRYADENAAENDLKNAADIAQASEFIYASPAGLSGEISQGGANVSGGQKQRLSIARALVKKAPIYIFDDSFSALDFKTDSALRRALKEKTGQSTVLIVTQRVSTIMNAEQIIVMDEGRIVGKGRHRDLMVNCETYREIALSQLSMEELA